MHELPELERQRAFLAERFAGKAVTQIEFSNKSIKSALKDAFAKDVLYASLWFVERRGNNFLFHLDNGKRLRLHWTETSHMYVTHSQDGKDAAKKMKKEKPVLALSFGESCLNLFGIDAEDIEVLTVREVENKLASVGQDPLDRHLSARQLRKLFARKRSSIKLALADDSVLSGIGQAYADEIIYRCQFNPARKLTDLVQEDWDKLYKQMRALLKEAVEYGGMNLKPLEENDQVSGGFKSHLQVFERDGEACGRCGEQIIKKTISKQKTYLCGSCQAE